VAKNDRRVRIEPGRGLEGALPDAIAQSHHHRYHHAAFQAGRLRRRCRSRSRRIVSVVNGEPLPEPDKKWERPRQRLGQMRLPLLFVVVFVAAGILRSVFGRLFGSLATRRPRRGDRLGCEPSTAHWSRRRRARVSVLPCCWDLRALDGRRRRLGRFRRRHRRIWRRFGGRGGGGGFSGGGGTSSGGGASGAGDAVRAPSPACRSVAWRTRLLFPQARPGVPSSRRSHAPNGPTAG